MDVIAFAVSAALAQVMTNLDNLAVLLALIVPMGTGRAVAGYVIAQIIMLSAAFLAGLGVAQVAPGQVAYLGLVPLGLGLWSLWKGADKGGADTAPNGGIIATVFIFLSLSLDSFAVMTPLLADSLPLYRMAALIGSLLAVAAMVGIAVVLVKPVQVWAPKLARLGAVAMILAGLYVLINTGTDIA